MFWKLKCLHLILGFASVYLLNHVQQILSMPDIMNTQELKIVTDKDVISKESDDVIRFDVIGIPEFDFNDVKRQIDTYKSLGFGEGKKGSLLIVTKGNVIMSKEARELSSVNTKKYFKKVAVVGHSLTVRFLVNFLNRFYKFDVEIRLFKNEKEALGWLSD